MAVGVNTIITEVAGIMGAEKVRLSRTVMSDPVNLASRLACEALKIGGGIIISGQLLEYLPADFVARKLPVSTVKGKTQSIEAFKISLKGAACMIQHLAAGHFTSKKKSEIFLILLLTVFCHGRFRLPAQKKHKMTVSFSATGAGAVSCGHPLAAAAAMQILNNGGCWSMLQSPPVLCSGL